MANIVLISIFFFDHYISYNKDITSTATLFDSDFMYILSISDSKILYFNNNYK